MKSWREYDADFEARVERYGERAELLRSAAQTVGAELRSDLLDHAQNLEELADIIEKLRLRDD